MELTPLPAAVMAPWRINLVMASWTLSSVMFGLGAGIRGTPAYAFAYGAMSTGSLRRGVDACETFTCQSPPSLMLTWDDLECT